jgi:hypothetical protein
VTAVFGVAAERCLKGLAIGGRSQAIGFGQEINQIFRSNVVVVVVVVVVCAIIILLL